MLPPMCHRNGAVDDKMDQLVSEIQTENEHTDSDQSNDQLREKRRKALTLNRAFRECPCELDCRHGVQERDGDAGDVARHAGRNLFHRAHERVESSGRVLSTGTNGRTNAGIQTVAAVEKTLAGNGRRFNLIAFIAQSPATRGYFHRD